MKVIHIESGLGNQMLSYCELLSLREVNPNDDFYVETLVYDFPEAARIISQWQGYELENVFQIKTSNIRKLFDDSQWESIVEEIRKSAFWSKSWNWPVYFTRAFANHGLELKNIRGDFEANDREMKKSLTGKRRNNIIYKMFQKTWLYSNLRAFVNIRKLYTQNDCNYLFYKSKDDVLAGQKLSFMYINNDIERIDAHIRKAFVFPEHSDQRNVTLERELLGCQSVAIHARRGDLLGLNGRYYKGGFFRRATRYIKKNVKNPVFYFFCDPGSTEWCRENLKVFGLDLIKDKIQFVDWNKGNESYRDMQLMAYCRHNIITISSFGWWGAYLNNNPNKITISPEPRINTTHHM